MTTNHNSPASPAPGYHVKRDDEMTVDEIINAIRKREHRGFALAWMITLANEIEELEAQIAGFMQEPGAAVKVYICEAVVNRWKARQTSSPDAMSNTVNQ